MAVKVRVPAPMQKLTQDQREVESAGATVAELIGNLEKSYPGVRGMVCDDTGRVRRFLNVYVNDKDIRFLEQEKTSLKEGDEVAIIPAIAGGA